MKFSGRLAQVYGLLKLIFLLVKSISLCPQEVYSVTTAIHTYPWRKMPDTWGEWLDM